MSGTFSPTEYPFKVSVEGSHVFFKSASGIREKRCLHDVEESDRKFYHDLVLEDGLLPEWSPFYNWVMHMIAEGGSLRVPAKDLLVTQFDAQGNVIKLWKIYNAQLMSWRVGDAVNVEGYLEATCLSFYYTGFDERAESKQA
jgi:hypothetical protein